MPLSNGRDKSGPYLTGNELPFLAQYMRTFHASFSRHFLASEHAAHRSDMIHHLYRAIHCVRGRDPIYRVRGVRSGNTLATPHPPACPDLPTHCASRVMYRVRRPWAHTFAQKSEHHPLGRPGDLGFPGHKICEVSTYYASPSSSICRNTCSTSSFVIFTTEAMAAGNSVSPLSRQS